MSARTCTGPECDRPTRTGLCAAHRKQHDRTGELWPLGTRGHVKPEGTPPMIEDAMWLLDQGESAEHVAARLGIRVEYLDIALQNAGINHPDAARAAGIAAWERQQAAKRRQQEAGAAA